MCSKSAFTRRKTWLQRETPIDVRFEGLTRSQGQSILASAPQCFNVGGIDTRGIVSGASSVCKRERWARSGAAYRCQWMPSPAITRGLLHLVPQGGGDLPVHLELEVKRDFLRAGGIDQPARLARLKWLNSTVGIEDTITAPYTSLRLVGGTVSCLGRDVRFGDSGFPASIRASGREVLAGPIGLQVYEGGSQPAPWKSASRVASRTAARVVMDSENDSNT